MLGALGDVRVCSRIPVGILVRDDVDRIGQVPPGRIRSVTVAKDGYGGPARYLYVEYPSIEVAMGDFIDHIAQQWQQERPDLDLSPTEVVGRIDRLGVYLRRAVDETLRDFDLHRGGFAVLAALRRSGAPYRLHPTELFTGLLSSSGAMTNRLDRLEAAGLVRRVSDPDDRRGVLVELTAAGRALTDQAAEAHLTNERNLLSSLTHSEQEQLASLLRTLLIVFENGVDTAHHDETEIR